MIEAGRERVIMIIVDPKGADFTKYAGATVLKPNLKEAAAAAHLSVDTPLDEIAAVLFSTSAIGSLMITRSEAGISLFTHSHAVIFPLKRKKSKT